MTINRVPAAALAALFALLTLAGCGEQDTTADAAVWPPITTETTPAPVPDAPTLDLPELGDSDVLTRIGEDAFVDTVDGEGITYPDREQLLATGRAACDAMNGATTGVGGDVFAAIDVFVADGYLESDAAFMAGAALGSLCLTEPGAGV